MEMELDIRKYIFIYRSIAYNLGVIDIKKLQLIISNISVKIY